KNKYNLNEIDELMSFSEDIGASSCHMLFLVDVGRGKLIGEHQLSKEEYKQAINEIITKEASIRIKPTCAPQYKVEAKFKELETVGGRGCIAGISYCSILPNGDVHICPYTPVKVDSIRDRPFDEIWNTNEVFLSLRDYSNYKGRCGECNYIDICGGCRARAYSATGDWLEEDPYCLLDLH
ncbi:MAG: SPASM domain-containing protein, partial [Halanaerobiales bacterium]